MTTGKGKSDKDTRALEAVLAAAYRLDSPREITDEEAEKFFQEPLRLSNEDKEAMNSWGTAFISKLLDEEKIVSGNRKEDEDTTVASEQDVYAMNRDKDGGEIDEDTRRKIDEERRKALEEEDNRDKAKDNES